MARESGGLQSAERLLAPAVAETLESLELQPEDAAVSKLAERYAREIDGASAAAAQAEKVLREVGEDPDTAELVAALKAKLGARSAMESLGPKLLAALDALGASPKARAARGKGGASRGTASKLAALRANRAG
ncbi:hypothetical protein B0I33_104491 [Prauserella shujinwangii]|uniref:Terminase small subunit actinomycetes phage-type domain-containing protein n=1 Tax=Prauserella shujinwangii TaxID=1453103 RepID=A0A2T0LXB8_9PSEU|nr:hypothetical protein [Prauserella shujinwangii]PRX48673.1 hypothetical protein B0I33_104491 [Prauserella shujinwangii]